MLERINPALRILCFGLAALMLYQVTRVFAKNDALQGLTMRKSQPAAAGTNVTAQKAAALPAPVQAKVDKIVQSEILGTVVRPLPMALLGIAGADAIVRAPNGQTILMREGDESGGVKLLQISINRVLVEHEGQTKELTLFSGLGSETLKETTK